MAQGFRLRTEHAASTEAQMIPGLPGFWTAGESVNPVALGLSYDEFEALADRNGYFDPQVVGDVETPSLLEKVTDAPDADPPPPGTMLSGATLPSAQVDSLLPRSTSDRPGLSEAEAAQRDAEDEVGAIPNAQRHAFPPEVFASQAAEGTVAEVVARIKAGVSDVELAALANDPRSGVKNAVEAERRARLEAAGGTTTGEES